MTKKDINYRELSRELENILEELQTSDDLDIDKTIKKYERGMEIASQLEEYLKSAENEVKKIDIKSKK